MLWCSFSSVGWNLSNVLVNEVVYIGSHIFGVSNVLLLWQVLECWVQHSVNGVLLSWVWSWVHTVVSIDKSMNLFPNLFVTNISLVLFSQGQMLESWVKNSIDGMLLSWIWGWVHAVVSIDESMNFFSNLLVSNVTLLGK